jgi:hypothetical protein
VPFHDAGKAISVFLGAPLELVHGINGIDGRAKELIIFGFKAK